MDKIVIVTRHPEPGHAMIRWLNTLFPECEVCVVSKEVEGLSGDPVINHEKSFGVLFDYGNGYDLFRQFSVC